MPKLRELKLNGSSLGSLRDLGSGLRHLQVLWVAHCGLTALEGLGALSALRELYASFNQIDDMQPLAGELTQRSRAHCWCTNHRTCSHRQVCEQTAVRQSKGAHSCPALSGNGVSIVLQAPNSCCQLQSRHCSV